MRNPLAFTPVPVSIFTTSIYFAVFAVLLVIHHQVPAPPSSAVPKSWPGVNLTTAWHDLQTLCKDHHPYNSWAGLEVRAWLQTRIGAILTDNHVSWATETSVAGTTKSSKHIANASAVLFDDRTSNTTIPDARPYSNYFEGDNLMVYIRGAADPTGAFWTNPDSAVAGLILVNAHFDSVSSGFGATDDGVGVITCLQLIAHWTSPKTPQPLHGLVILINDAEEDGLYGAAAYATHPLARHATAFLNLEGAGAGGRATLFRATDGEVTAPYGKSEHPFGTIISGDAFKHKIIRSGTDYEVFTDVLGMRGLDVAFMAPRSRYHTKRDDVRNTSPASVWHMLSAALATTKGLVKQEWELGEKHEVPGVWFDVLGRGFAVLRLHTLFALDVTLLVVGPIALILLELLLKKYGKWYPFSLKTYVHGEDDDEPVQLGGLRGFFRFPLAFAVATAAVVALALLVTKINPYIVYSSPYAIWAMMLSAFASISWFLLRMGDALRPSALSRLYTLLWLYIASWVLLVGATVAADHFKIGGAYFFLVYNASVFAALLISYLELFALPSKSKFAKQVTLAADADDRSVATRSRPTSSHVNEEEGESNERTALLSAQDNASRSDRQTFARYRREDADDDAASVQALSGAQPYEHEQLWSAYLPRWTWIFQLLALLPINLILIGQGALLLTNAMSQTPADGNPVLTIYLAMAVLSVLLLVLSAPIVHRIVWQIPTFLFLVFVRTLVYNLIANPFSREAQLKVFFVQRIDVETGVNHAALLGVDGWLQKVVAELPSTAGKNVTCGHNIADWAVRNEIHTCIWPGLEPNVMQDFHDAPGPESVDRSAELAPYKHTPKMKDWVSVSAKKDNSSSNGNSWTIKLSGLNTRACRLYFDTPVSDFTVLNACPDATGTKCEKGRQIEYPGVDPKSQHKQQLRLWSRTFDPTFEVVVDVAKNETSLVGRATCLWSDVNQVGTVPAFDEVRDYAPIWATVTKQADGLVEGVREFNF